MPEPKARILIVDDDPLVRDLAEIYLSSHEVSTTPDGLGCLAALDARPLDLILLDIAMPRMNGLETLKRLRARSASAQVAVMMLTAAADRNTVSTALAAGADAYMLKPFTRDTLVRRVRVVLKAAAGIRRRSPAGEPLELEI